MTVTVNVLWFPSSVQVSRSVVSDSLRPHGPQHTRPPCPSPTPRIYPNSSPLSWWCHLTISSSVVPFSSCLQSLPTSGYFQMSHVAKILGVSDSTSVLPTQDWFPLGWTGWISLQSMGLRRIFSSTLRNMQSTSCEMLSWLNHKLELWTGRNINNLRYADDTTLMAESKEELKNLLMKEKREELKSWLKTQHSKNKDHGIQSHHFMAYG